MSSRPRSSASSPPTSTRTLPEDTAWHAVDELPPLAFDHGEIVLAGRERLRGKLSYTNVGFALAPPTFTLSELRDLYAAALGHDVSATNLKRVLLRRDVLEPTGSRREPGRAGGRPAEVYRFRVRAARDHRPVRRAAPSPLTSPGRPCRPIGAGPARVLWRFPYTGFPVQSARPAPVRDYDGRGCEG